MSSSLFNKIQYKKSAVGFTEKGGKVYVKYKKVRRFTISKNVKYIGLSFFILGVLAVGIKLLMYEMIAQPRVEETVE